jgi:hypothetical protein
MHCSGVRIARNITDVAGAAEILGLSTSRVKELDDVLQPWRFGRKGRLRLYLVSAIERYAALRDAAKESR